MRLSLPIRRMRLVSIAAALVLTLALPGWAEEPPPKVIPGYTPPSAKDIEGYGRPPYQFTYENDLPRTIASDLLKAAPCGGVLPVLQIVWDRSDPPLTLADRRGFRQKIVELSLAQGFSSRDTRRQQPLALCFEVG